jgi:hypothetical protein
MSATLWNSAVRMGSSLNECCFVIINNETYRKCKIRITRLETRANKQGRPRGPILMPSYLALHGVRSR